MNQKTIKTIEKVCIMATIIGHTLTIIGVSGIVYDEIKRRKK
jgi:hypothetical protein